MKRINNINLIGLSAALSFILLFTLLPGCKKLDPLGSISVKMIDGPADVKEINVEIIGLSIHYEKAESAEWIHLSVKEGVYNLLQLQNNVTAILTDKYPIPPGKVNQLRLLLGTHNNVIVFRDSNRLMYELKIPSAYNTGIKINIDSKIMRGKDLVLTLDFDAKASINQEGNGDYIMKPVIKVKSINYE